MQSLDFKPLGIEYNLIIDSAIRLDGLVYVVNSKFVHECFDYYWRIFELKGLLFISNF